MWNLIEILAGLGTVYLLWRLRPFEDGRR